LLRPCDITPPASLYFCVKAKHFSFDSYRRIHSLR
jgi:hypothetical protein